MGEAAPARAGRAVAARVLGRTLRVEGSAAGCRREASPLLGPQSHGARTASKRSSPGLGAAAASSKSKDRWKLPASGAKDTPSRRTSHARSHAVSRTKSDRLFPSTVAARSRRSRSSAVGRSSIATSGIAGAGGFVTMPQMVAGTGRQHQGVAGVRDLSVPAAGRVGVFQRERNASEESGARSSILCSESDLIQHASPRNP